MRRIFDSAPECVTDTFDLGKLGFIGLGIADRKCAEGFDENVTAIVLISS